MTRPNRFGAWSALLMLSVALLSTASLAQNEEVSFTVDKKLPNGTLRFNRASCTQDETFFLQWRLTGPDETFYWEVRLQDQSISTNDECPNPLNFAGDVLIPQAADPTALLDGRLFVEDDYLPSQLMGEDGCDTAGRRGNYFLCLYLYDLADPEPVWSNHFITDIDSEVPAAPSIASAVAGDRQVTLNLELPEPLNNESLRSTVFYRPCYGLPDPFFVSGDLATSDGGTTTTSGDAGTTTTSGSLNALNLASSCDAAVGWKPVTGSATVVLDGLLNNIPYEAVAVVSDDFENVSEPSEIVQVESIPELSAIGLYDGEPNPFSSSGPACAQANGAASSHAGWLSLLAMLLAFFQIRRGKRRRRGASLLAGGAAAVVLISATLAQPAAAHFGQLTVGAKVGPYTPAIDSELKANGDPIYPIYKCFFDDGIMPLPGLDVDMHLLDFFGSLQLGMGFGITQAVGSTFEEGSVTATMAAAGQCPNAGAKGSADQELTLLFLRPALTYRFDPLLEWFGFPLVPYARVGLVGVGYAFTRGGAWDNAGQSSSPSQNPFGMRFGYEVSAGMMLDLGFIDLINLWDFYETGSTSRGKRASSWVDRSFFFVEGVHQGIQSFSSVGFNFSPADRVFGSERIFAGGIPLTFNVGIAVELL